MTTLLSTTNDNAPPQPVGKNSLQPLPASTAVAPEPLPADTDQKALKQQIQKIISDCRAFIQHAQAKIDEATRDKRITGWFEVNFHHNATTLAACKVPATLQGPRDNFKNELPHLLSRLQYLENDIGNLAADFKLFKKLPKTTLPRARQLEEKHQELQTRLDATLADCKQLKDSHINLCKNLTPAMLLPLARDIAADKGPIFEIGYKLYRMTSSHKQEGDEEKNLDDFFCDANKQETLLSKITFPELPKLAATVIREQIKTTIKIISTLKDGIDLFRENFASELRHTNDTEARIARLGKEETPELLNKISKEAEALYRGMLRFHYKAHHLDKIYDIEEILLLLQLLQRAIKNDLQEKLKREISIVGNPLNPETAAATAAEEFLKGGKGFWRGVKLLLRLLMGKQTVNLTSFEATLRDALNSCETFYGDTPEDIQLMETFINDQLSAYDEPFPRNDLYNIMKKCLHDYGSDIERYCLSFKIDTSSFAAKKENVSIKKIISQIRTMSAKLAE